MLTRSRDVAPDGGPRRALRHTRAGPDAAHTPRGMLTRSRQPVLNISLFENAPPAPGARSPSASGLASARQTLPSPDASSSDSGLVGKPASRPRRRQRRSGSGGSPPPSLTPRQSPERPSAFEGSERDRRSAPAFGSHLCSPSSSPIPGFGSATAPAGPVAATAKAARPPTIALPKMTRRGDSTGSASSGSPVRLALSPLQSSRRASPVADGPAKVLSPLSAPAVLARGGALGPTEGAQESTVVAKRAAEDASDSERAEKRPRPDSHPAPESGPDPPPPTPAPMVDPAVLQVAPLVNPPVNPPAEPPAALAARPRKNVRRPNPNPESDAPKKARKPRAVPRLQPPPPSQQPRARQQWTPARPLVTVAPPQSLASPSGTLSPASPTFMCSPPYTPERLCDDRPADDGLALGAARITRRLQLSADEASGLTDTIIVKTTTDGEAMVGRHTMVRLVTMSVSSSLAPQDEIPIQSLQYPRALLTPLSLEDSSPVLSPGQLISQYVGGLAGGCVFAVPSPARPGPAPLSPESAGGGPGRAALDGLEELVDLDGGFECGAAAPRPAAVAQPVDAAVDDDDDSELGALDALACAPLPDLACGLEVLDYDIVSGGSAGEGSLPRRVRGRG